MNATVKLWELLLDDILIYGQYYKHLYKYTLKIDFIKPEEIYWFLNGKKESLWQNIFNAYICSTAAGKEKYYLAFQATIQATIGRYSPKTTAILTF